MPINDGTIRNWLRQFGEENLELGLKLLNYVDFYSPSRILTESIELHNQLKAYKEMENEELLNIPTYFIDLSFSSGRSQDEFIPKYRLASGLRYDSYDKNFLYLRDITQFFDKRDITLVFLTDFIGSGNQVAETWLSNLWAISEKNEHILLAINGFESGIKYIEDITEDKLTIITNKKFNDTHKICSPTNADFIPEEKEIINKLCHEVGDFPLGFKDVQSSIIFYFRCPNSTISIYRTKNARWTGLFLRHI
jgi:hypothetical protein